MTSPAPDLDTAMVLGMASTALPFADSPEAEAERWLRILRMYGEAGSVLQSLGVSEAPLEAGDAPSDAATGGSEAPQNDVIRAVTERAVRVAAQRGAQTVGAGDVLVAVMDVYGADFDRVLRVHGTDRDEVLERLGVEPLWEGSS
jgi:hypothetical protein